MEWKWIMVSPILKRKILKKSKIAMHHTNFSSSIQSLDTEVQVSWLKSQAYSWQLDSKMLGRGKRCLAWTNSVASDTLWWLRTVTLLYIRIVCILLSRGLPLHWQQKSSDSLSFVHASWVTDLSWQPQTLREAQGWIHLNIELVREIDIPELLQHMKKFLYHYQKSFWNTLPTLHCIVHYTLTPGITRTVLIITMGLKLMPRLRMSGTVFILSAKRIK